MKNLSTNRLNRLISDLQNACEGTPYHIDIPSYYRQHFSFRVSLSRSAFDAAWHAPRTSTLAMAPEIYIQNDYMDDGEAIKVKVQTVSYGSLELYEFQHLMEAMNAAATVASKLQQIVDEAHAESIKAA